ncbi:class I SAM-dependent methyltransferase [Thioalkalivibrio sp. XN279]|uniref:class I SAM-dependent methyltransferase n=1 Tax=Thioalkalivibrio sp. XN279 TaxID=2714953 RepID=UPI00351AFADA
MSSNPADWPAPDADARTRSAALLATLRAETVRAGGAISFRRFMEAALYAPGLGYYSGGAAKLGPAGDFVTAPELSPLFGRCVARQARAVLEAIGGGAVLELGGGSGALAEAALAEVGELRWLMLEPSPELRQRQQQRLGDRAEWLDTLPQDFRGVILANEVADALPVERFTVQAGEVHALGVRFDADGVPAWALLPPAPELAAAVRALETARGAPFPDGYVSEFSPLLQPWVCSLADSLAAGLLLVIDYGLPRAELYAPERSMGTLMCHYRHRAHDDPFLWPGLQDITAWVDFTAMTEAGVERGLTLEGYTTQAAFLAGNGLEAMLQEGGSTAGIMQAQQARRLLLPAEMGERFRVLGLSRALAPALDGFGLLDLANRL